MGEQPRKIQVTKAASLREYADAPARLQRIHFEGIERTKEDALLKETQTLFKASTVRDLVVLSYQAKTHIVEMGLFKNAEVILDVDQEGKPGCYEATFVVGEPKPVRGSIFGSVNYRGEAQSTLCLETPSFQGRGEHLTGDVTMNYNATYSKWHVGLHKPLLGWQRYAGALVNVGRGYSESPWSKFSLLENSVTAEFYHHPIPTLKHQIRWTGATRYLRSLTDSTAFAVREHSGYTVKSSLTNIFTYSTQDSVVMPTRGLLARLSTELAGFGGDVKFLRQDLELSTAYHIRVVDIILAANLSATAIRARSGPTLHMADRCFLGGPQNLRGFGFNAVGDSEDSCALGGDASLVAGVHLYKPLWPRRMVYGHLFAVAGNIHDVSNRDSPARVAAALSANPRISLGAGFVINLVDRIRLELNYAVPISHRARDPVVRGFQFGAGVKFD